jgi:hypothetical protein
MKVKWAGILGVAAVIGLAFLWVSCASTPANCTTCGTTVNGAYGVIDVIPVPEHNPTGEPGGPFNSFDISWLDTPTHRFYVSDRIGLAIVVVDSFQHTAINTIGGANAVTNGGNNASACDPSIPSILTGLGNLTRFGCRNPGFFNNFGQQFPGFGPNGLFGGFPGAQCCAARANGVNPLSAPDGNVVTPDGKTLFVGSGSSSVVVFDLTTNPAMVIADFPTGQSPDYDGCSALVTPCLPGGTVNPNGIAPCVASANGRAFADPTCGDLRADEMAYGVVGGRDLLLVGNGDPGLPFVTIVDVTDLVNRNFAGPFNPPAGMGHCLPVIPSTNYGPTNFPTCILGQIYYDASPTNDSTVAVDTAGAPCPDPSTLVPSGVSGTGVGAAPLVDVPCHHGPILDQNTGAFIPYVAGISTAGAGQGGAIAVAGIGGSAFNPAHGTFFVTNSNSTVSSSPTQASVAVGSVDEIDPRIGNPNGPIVVNSYPMLNCMPTSVVQGPGTDFLVGCGDHDGISFPPNMIIINGNTGVTVATFDQIGGVDEIWYNPGDNRYYLAARDYPSGPQLGVIDAGRRQWLTNVTTNSNSHSIAVDATINHIFVPSQSGGICGTQSGNGCILVYARQ